MKPLNNLRGSSGAHGARGGSPFPDTASPSVSGSDSAGLPFRNQLTAALDFQRQSAADSKATERLRSKLVTVGERFVGFDKQLEQEGVRRRQDEERRLAEISEHLIKLEKAMNSEIKRRVEANKALQQMTGQLANDTLERLQKQLLDKMEKMRSEIQDLSKRCETLEMGLQQFRGELPSQIQVETTALAVEIEDLRTKLSLEQKRKNDRHVQQDKRLDEIEEHWSSKFETSTKASDEEVATLTQLMNGLDETAICHMPTDTSKTNDAQFRMFVVEELANIKSSIAVEEKTREQTDEEVLQAIHQYASAMQKALRNFNHRNT